MPGGIKRIGSNRGQGINTGISNVPSRQGLLKVNNLQFPVVTDWVSYTPTNLSAGFSVGTTGELNGQWRRIGDSMEVSISGRGNGTGISGGLGQWNWTIPTPYLIDMSKASAVTNLAPACGSWVLYNVTAPSASTGTVGAWNASTVVMMREGANSQINNNNPATNWFDAVNDTFSLHFMVPIQGWTSNGEGTIEEIVERSFFNLKGQDQIFGLYHFNNGGQLMTGISDSVPTDVTGFSLFLPVGDYIIWFGGMPSVGFTESAPSGAYGNLTLSKSNNDWISFSIDNIGQRTSSNSGSDGQCTGMVKFTSTGETIKLRIIIVVNGGSGTITRSLRHTYLFAQKVG